MDRQTTENKRGHGRTLIKGMAAVAVILSVVVAMQRALDERIPI